MESPSLRVSLETASRDCELSFLRDFSASAGQSVFRMGNLEPNEFWNISAERDHVPADSTWRAIRSHLNRGVNTMVGKTSKKSASVAKKTVSKRSTAKPKLLAGGNPQIAKGDGDAPVQAYIAAMPGWKRDVGRRLDALIASTVPSVRKAVKWNSPFYGIEDQGWFLGIHCLTKYIKVAFFRGTSLSPVPPVESKQKEVRYFHIHEDDVIDEAQFAAWVNQASQLPGERI